MDVSAGSTLIGGFAWYCMILLPCQGAGIAAALEVTQQKEMQIKPH